MKKKALMKLLAVSLAATMLFTGCGKTETQTSETSKESVVETVSTETAKTSETTATSETAKTTESATTESEAKTESKSADVEVTELDKTMYVTKLINVRSGPHTKYERVTTLKKGQEVHVTGQTSDGWYRLDLDGKEAWCPPEDCLTEDAPAE